MNESLVVIEAELHAGIDAAQRVLNATPGPADDPSAVLERLREATSRADAAIGEAEHG